jgi:hypothetical protein
VQRLLPPRVRIPIPALEKMDPPHRVHWMGLPPIVAAGVMRRDQRLQPRDLRCFRKPSYAAKPRCIETPPSGGIESYAAQEFCRGFLGLSPWRNFIAPLPGAYRARAFSVHFGSWKML